MLICAIIIAPFGTIWFLKTNEVYNVGYSWATVTTTAKLRKIGNLFKKGKYREALDLFEPYCGSDDYTESEIEAFKDLFAERFEDYFESESIKNISYYAEAGECRRGYLTVSTVTDYSNSSLLDTFSIVFLNNEDGSLEFLEYQGEWYDYSSLPNMVLPAKNSAEQFFDNLNSNVRNFSYWLYTRERVESENSGDRGGWYGDAVEKNDKRITELLKNYSYVGCKGGEILYGWDFSENSAFSDFFKNYNYLKIFDNYNLFVQKTTLTMQSKDGGQFTVEFELPMSNYVSFTMLNNNYIGNIWVGSRYTGLWNITYSENTPEDFKTMFEDIFVGQEIEEPPLNEGNFYLNGNKDSCYFNVSNGNIRFIVGSKEQMQEYHNAQIEADSSLKTRNFNFDEWYKQLEEEWKEPIPYIVHTDFSGSVNVAWSVGYDDDGNITGYLCARYIDENNIKTSGCVFTRVEE